MRMERRRKPRPRLSMSQRERDASCEQIRRTEEFTQRRGARREEETVARKWDLRAPGVNLRPSLWRRATRGMELRVCSRQSGIIASRRCCKSLVSLAAGTPISR